MDDKENSVISAICSGTRAFMRTVAHGGSYLSSQVSDRLLTHIQRGHLRTYARTPLEALLPRELQVLRLDARGKTRIAVLLDLGLQTVCN